MSDVIKEQLIEAIKNHYAVIYYDDTLLNRMAKLIENLSIFKGTTTSLSIKWLVKKYIVRYSESQDVFYHTVRHMMARDADLLMSLCPDVDHFAKGLSLETKVEHTKQTMTDFVKGQTLYTPLAKEWFDAQVVLDV